MSATARFEPLGLTFTTNLAWAASDPHEALAAAWGQGDAIVLGHAWDAVFWGRVQQGQLTLADGAALPGDALLDLRVFSPSRELRVWRRPDGFGAVLVLEVDPEAAGAQVFQASVERPYELIRPTNPPADGSFVEMLGLAGQRHTPPGNLLPRAITVRHYYSRDTDTGLLRMAEHRLLRLEPWTTSSREEQGR